MARHTSKCPTEHLDFSKKKKKGSLIDVCFTPDKRESNVSAGRFEFSVRMFLMLET